MFGRRRRRSSKPLVSEINVVPYIDVMLVLLVIFMITAPLIYQGVNVDLPKSGAKALTADKLEPIVVSVDKQGSMFLNIDKKPNTAMHPKTLILRVAAEMQRYPERKVLVKGDRGANYGQVVGAMVLLQKAGVGGVGLVTDNSQRMD